MPSFYQGSGIGEVVVNKVELIEILKTNQGKHHEVFEQAVELWQQKALKLVSDWAKEIKNGKRPRLTSNLPQPEEHLDDYARNIRMLEMHQSDTVTISEEAFMNLVEDRWGWSDLFMSNTVAYVSNSK